MIRHTIAAAGGMKRRGGGQLTLDDFLPDYLRKQKKPKDPAMIEARLKTTLNALAKFQNG